MIDDIRDIHDGLEQLQSVPFDADDLRARVHQFKLNPPLGEDEVRQFENDHQIQLPEDYRTFLIHIGNGGIGPAYGVFKLGERDDGWGYAPWEENDGFVGCLSTPFPHTEGWNELPPDLPYDPLNHAEWERLTNEADYRYFDPSHLNGAIPICDYGCNRRLWLVVNGSEAGHLWWDDRADRIGIYPYTIRAIRPSFFDWYREWLDKELAQLKK